MSLVVAINKIQCPSRPDDYWPISLLYYVSKFIEKLVSVQAKTFIEEKRLLDQFQSGYWAYHSTQTALALLKLTDDIRVGIRNKKVTFLLLFDFSKAFDTDSHVRVLQKKSWLLTAHSSLSYLSPRFQSVFNHKSTKSSFLPINRGVLQGSVLGPLLFALFINDI